ncbi:MAG: Maf family protein [Bacillota bacterium]
MEIVLASASPRRRMLLEQLGLDFVVQPSTIDESSIAIKEPQELVQQLSYLKASDVKTKESQVVIAADTVVSIGDEILEKPADKCDAKKMLNTLSGTTHQVVTGITIISSDKTVTNYEVTDVFFKKLTNNEIEEYIATGEPLDKAGGYGIQGLGAVFVKKINGCFYNVVGLSLYRLVKMIKKIGLEIELSD